MRDLDRLLYGEDEDEGFDKPVVEEPSSMPIEESSSMPVEDDEGTLNQPEPQTSPVASAASAPSKPGFKPNFLAAIAAFTQNPVLMQQLQAQRQGKKDDLQRSLLTERQGKADARQAELDGISKEKNERERRKFAAIEPFLADSETSKIESRQAGADRMRGNAESQRSKMDPESSLSKRSVQSAKKILQLYADNFGGAQGQRLMEAANSLEGKSAEEVEGLRASFEKLGAAQFARQHQKVMEDQGWTGLAETQRYHNISDENADLSREAGEKARTYDKLPAEGQQKVYRGAISALDEVRQAKNLLNKGTVRYTGWGADYANKLLSKTPDRIDPRNADEIKLAELLGALTAESRHEIYGGAINGFEGADSEKWLPSINNNTRSLTESLNKMERGLDDGVKFIETAYPRMGQIRKQVSGGAQKKQQSAPSRRTPDGAKPGNEYDYKDGSTWKVQPDMTMKRVK